MTTPTLSDAATDYLNAIVTGTPPKAKGAVATAIQKKLRSAGLITPKGNPTKKGRELVAVELKETAAAPEIPDTFEPVYDDDKLIGWVEHRIEYGKDFYHIYVNRSNEAHDIGFHLSKNVGIKRLRSLFKIEKQTGSMC